MNDYLKNDWPRHKAYLCYLWKTPADRDLAKACQQWDQAIIGGIAFGIYFFYALGFAT